MGRPEDFARVIVDGHHSPVFDEFVAGTSGTGIKNPVVLSQRIDILVDSLILELFPGLRFHAKFMTTSSW